MTAQQIINNLQSEGLTLLRLSQILGISSKSAFDYKHGQEPAYRCEKRLQRNYKIYKLQQQIDAESHKMGGKVRRKTTPDNGVKCQTTTTTDII